MSDQSTKAPVVGRDVCRHLTDFDDDLDEFRDNLSFFCDAVIAMLQVDAGVDPATWGGAKATSEQMKRQLEELRAHSGRLRATLLVELATHH
ncbi:hypothetical protein [Marinimicrobium sp. ABcell2]|uniref:hypothetical protein n=1 Tax=Marinimicrobium sp. ABcell2 TaxID=3069751 RepID=UPI0027B296D5|nr:hypothetical protein [Marinimicrobium sp. ABcell2]MDQ2076776.1 hypothetical protein [Marinimicrobium sp. ABcell2]